MSQHLKNENYLREGLYNKKILLIGGGSTELKSWENSVDPETLWVRVNNNFITQGGRVDMIYTSGTQSPPPESKSAFVVECRPLPEETPSKWKRPLRFLQYDTNFYLKENPNGPEHAWVTTLSRLFNSMPLTGVLAVAHLLSMPIRELEIVGFDFYQPSDPDEPLVLERDSHRFENQILWLIEKATSDHRVIVNKILSGIFHRFVDKQTEEVLNSITNQMGELQ